MTVIATEKPRVGNVLKHEYDPASNYCREQVDVTIPAGGISVGAVLDVTGALVDVANTADASYVLVDDRANGLVSTTAKLSCIARGPAIVAKEALSYAADVDTDNEKNSVLAILAAKGILTQTQI